MRQLRECSSEHGMMSSERMFSLYYRNTSLVGNCVHVIGEEDIARGSLRRRKTSRGQPKTPVSWTPLGLLTSLTQLAPLDCPNEDTVNHTHTSLPLDLHILPMSPQFITHSLNHPSAFVPSLRHNNSQLPQMSFLSKSVVSSSHTYISSFQ